jgi:hypothetical protein
MLPRPSESPEFSTASLLFRPALTWFENKRKTIKRQFNGSRHTTALHPAIRVHSRPFAVQTL